MAAPASAGTVDSLMLKVTPPRVPRHLVARRRLLSADDRLLAQPVILVQAPAGFGKTSLLAQWRREHLGRGAVVAWLSAQSNDDPGRLTQALALAVRTGAARPGFGHTLLAAPPASASEAMTTWLAEVAQTALDVVLIADEIDRLPPDSLEALAYLLHNVPPNLRVVLAARSDCRLDIDDLVDYGQCSVIGPSQLRFDLAETIELVHSRLGASVDHDAAARLHDLAEGWPLGLQLALTVMSGGIDPKAEIAALGAGGGLLRDQFVGVLLANLDPDDLALLTRVSFVDALHPALCAEL
ncbi:MAG TPA: AAA family ATPase, partial [Caldimonas sp.]|nr:AAA family ATPase [Caldimonas sp.]